MGLINVLKGFTFFNSTIKEYIENRKSGISRFEANRMLLSKNIKGTLTYRFSEDANTIISLFDVVDTVQFLMYFNDKIADALPSVPKRRSGARRIELLQGLFPKQFNFLNNLPDLRNNQIDCYEEFETLTNILKADLNIY